MSRLLWMVLLAMVGCGGGATPSLIDDWTGVASFVVLEGEPVAFPMRLSISEMPLCDLSGPLTLAVTNMCPVGGGRAFITETGTLQKWDGAIICTPIATASCQFVGVTYTAMSVTLNDDDTLTLSGKGTSYGCGINGSMKVDFIGHRAASFY